jgi:hypothetical protein
METVWFIHGILSLRIGQLKGTRKKNLTFTVGLDLRNLASDREQSIVFNPMLIKKV